MRILFKLCIWLIVLIAVGIGFSLSPLIANPMIKRANQMLFASQHYPAMAIYRYYETFNNAIAMNNLGVVYYRGLGVKRDKQKAISYFEKAAEKRVVQGRYNLVLTMENRFKTPEDIIKRQYELLEANIAAGDIHSHVVFARRLYFANRDRFYPNHEQKKLELLKTAAHSGDTDYVYQYGQELEVQAFVDNNANMMTEALTAYRQVYEAGDMRGAEMLGSARSIRDWNITPSREELLEKPEMEWTLIAARAGRVAAKCRYGIRRLRNKISIDSVEFPSDTLQNVDIGPASPEEFIDFLEECANAKRVRFSPNPPFGELALYARKRRGSVPGIANSPGWAITQLGKLYASGTLVEKDLYRALDYFQSKPKFGDADEWIRYLTLKLENGENTQEGNSDDD